MADSEDRRSLFSLIISRLLCMNRINSSRLQISRSLTHAEEYIHRQLRSEHDGQKVLTGSMVEGLRIQGSDYDIMLVIPRVVAARYAHSQSDEKLCELVMDMEGVRQGFSKLKLYNTTKSNPTHLPTVIKYSFIHTDPESVYCSSDKIREYFFKNLSKDFSYDYSDVSLHGPCSTVTENIFTGTYSTDLAYAIECIAWPQEAMEWVSRPRTEGWPSEEEISRLKEMPCYLMAVGDPTSDNCHLELRFAFVPTERELIWSFNDTQIHCLFLLKQIKRDLESLAPDQLSSFYFKTILFWESEKHGLDMWRHDNLLNCVHQCLETLKSSIKSRELSHYIYRKRNLLYSKFNDQQQQTAVLQKISDIQNKITKFLLEMLHIPEDYCNANEEKGTLLKHPLIDNKFKESRKQAVEMEDWKYRHIMYKTMLVRFGFMFGKFHHLTQEIIRISCLIQDINQNKINLEAPDKKVIISFLSTRIGNAILSEICKAKEINNKDELIQLATLHFEKGQNLDSTSGPLYLATFFYACKEYKKALKTITDVCSNSNKERSFYIGSSTQSGPLMPNKSYEETLISDNKAMAIDVVFRPDDAGFVPHAVKFELALNKQLPCAAFHPLVYAYYLYFQICLDLNDKEGCSKAIQKLLQFRDLVSEKRDNPICTFNLLGFCFYKSGWCGVAMECFKKSLKLWDSTWNAAALHLWFMFLDIEKTTNLKVK